MDANDMKQIDVPISNDDCSSGRLHDFDVDENTLLRKIDWRIVPTMFLAYLLQFLDKVAINYSAVMGLEKDLKMTGNDFSWTATAFFLGYAIAELPQGMLLQRYSPVKVLGCNILLWGIILCCSAACNNTASIIAVRTLLGVCEAVIAPALILITSMWYTKNEGTLRFGLWYCGLGAGQILGGLISFAAQHSTSSFHGWRIMFLAIGAVNMLLALVILFTFPESPGKARFLFEEERTAVFVRLDKDLAGTGEKVFRWKSVVQVFLDVQTWLLILLTLMITISSGVITTFSSTLIHGFGYNSKETALLNMPSGVVSIFATIISTYAVAKRFPRWLSIIVLLIPALIGACLLSFIGKTNKGGSLAGIYLVNFIVAPLALIYAWVGANYVGYTRKITGSAIVSVSFGVANIIGPQTYQARDKPDYLPATETLVATIACGIVVAAALRLLWGVRNKTANETGETAKSRFEKTVDGDHNPKFRYVY